MKRFLIFSILFISVFNFAQEKPIKLGFFSSVDANVGLDLGDIIRSNQAKTDYEKSQLPPGKFNYGLSGMIGFQPLNWLSISGGLRYSFIDPNYHLIYYKIQPQFYLGNNDDDDLNYLFFNFGNKLNKTAANKASFVGIGVGRIETLSKRFGHQFQLHLDYQNLDREANVFIGFSYGIVLFSNQNL